jgi:hypothetical protein
MLRNIPCTAGPGRDMHSAARGRGGARGCELHMSKHFISKGSRSNPGDGTFHFRY